MGMVRVLRAVVSVLVVATFLVVMSSLPVAAGSSNWKFDREHYQPGDVAFAWSPIAWEHNANLGTPAEGPYHVFVVPYSPDLILGDPFSASATPVGDLLVSLEPYGEGPIRFGPHHVELRFTVPNLSPGRYQLVHANDAGIRIGDLVGGNPFSIDASAVRAEPRFTG